MNAPPPKPPEKLAVARGLACAKALDAVDSTRRTAVEHRRRQIAPSMQVGYLRAAAGTASVRQAVKAFCLECVGWQRDEVTRCTAVACPLWLYRPFQLATTEDDSSVSVEAVPLPYVRAVRNIVSRGYPSHTRAHT